jgi:hypothetical protein
MIARLELQDIASRYLCFEQLVQELHEAGSSNYALGFMFTFLRLI